MDVLKKRKEMTFFRKRSLVTILMDLGRGNSGAEGPVGDMGDSVSENFQDTDTRGK